MRSPTADAMPELGGPAPLFPPLVLATLFACVSGAAALANCALLAAVFKRSSNGLHAIMVQLAVADVALVATALGPEIWSSNNKTWPFGSGGCIAYRGLSVLTSTASLYLVTTLALHALATVNLEAKATIQRNKIRERDEDEEIRSSRHSLVANSDTSTATRTMNVDYRLADAPVSIAQPSIFVWVLSVSLSIPEFALATTVRVDRDIVVCTLVDSSHKVQMQSLLAVFNLFLPVLILITASFRIVLTLSSQKLRSQIEGSESIAALKLSLSLIFVYGTLCSPRSVIIVYNIYTAAQDKDIELVINNMLLLLSILFSSTYLVATVVRPILCIISIPHLTQLFSFGLRSAVNNV